MPTQALIVIDVQNDYFPEGKYPTWNADITLNRIEQAIATARTKDITVILVQHIAPTAKGLAPFLNEGTNGAGIHPRILAAAPDSIIVTKRFADSFHHTTLEAELSKRQVDTLLICGMLTQNCVTHTAISKAAEKYAVTILPDCCTTDTQMTHALAMNALAVRLPLVASDSVFN